MTKNDMAEFTKLLTGLAAMFERQLTELIRDMYYNALKDLDIEQIRDAANNIAQTSTFFPKPVDFRNAISGDKDSAAISAWEKVLKAKSKVGQYQSVQFDDPVIHSVIKLMGGWGAVCRLEGHDDEKWQRIDFEKTYKALLGRNADHPKYLPGIQEVENEAKGFESEKKVALIGDGKVVESLKITG